MIGVLIAVSGVVAGWEAHKWFEHESLKFYLWVTGGKAYEPD